MDVPDADAVRRLSRLALTKKDYASACKLAHAIKVVALSKAIIIEAMPMGANDELISNRAMAIFVNYAKSAGMAQSKDVFVTAAARALVPPWRVCITPVGSRPVVLEQLLQEHSGEATAAVVRSIIDADVANTLSSGYKKPAGKAAAFSLSAVAAVIAGLCPANNSRPPILFNDGATQTPSTPTLYAATCKLPGSAHGPCVGYTANGNISVCTSPAHAVLSWLAALQACDDDVHEQLLELAGFILDATPSAKLSVYL